MYMLKELFTDLLARKCYGQYSLMCEHDTTQEGDPRNEGITTAHCMGNTQSAGTV